MPCWYEFVKDLGYFVLAVWGLSLWRRQLVGKKESDTAETFLSSAYNLKMMIVRFRKQEYCGFEDGSLVSADLTGLGQEERVKQLELGREMLIEAGEKYVAASMAFKVLYEGGRGRIFDDISNLVNEFSVAVTEELRKAVAGVDLDETSESLRIAIKVDPENDVYGERIEETFKVAEKYLKRKLRLQTWHRPDWLGVPEVIQRFLRFLGFRSREES